MEISIAPATAPQPLSSSEILDFITRLQHPEPKNRRDLAETLINEINALPGVESAQLILSDPKTASIRTVWQALDGSLEFGDWSDLHDTMWSKITQPFLTQVTTESSPIPSLPSPEAPFIARCVIPIPYASELLAIISVQSSHEQAFHEWDIDALQLFSRHLGLLLESTRRVETLDNKLEKQKKQATLKPASLEGMLHIAKAVQNELEPINTYLQHNIQTFRRYIQTLQNVMDYQLDEIRLRIGNEGVQRVTQHAEQNKLPDIMADINTILQDSADGVFHINTLLKTLKELDTEEALPSPFQLDELFPPLLPLVFKGPLPRVEMDWGPLPTLYGQKTRFQKAILVLLCALQKHISMHTASPKLTIQTTEEDGNIHLRISFPLPEDAEPGWDVNENGYLFSKRVIEEHQGRFLIVQAAGESTFELIFPSMFAHSEGAQDTILELPAINADASYEPAGMELDAVPLPTQDEPTSKGGPPKRPRKLQLLLFGDDQRYLRSVKRILGARHDVNLASTTRSALDQIEGNSDLNLILCDLQWDAEKCLEFVDDIQNQAPQHLRRLCFFEGGRLKPNVREFASKVANRCCPRNAASQDIEEFVQQHVRLLELELTPPIPLGSSQSLDELPQATLEIDIK